MPHQRDKPAIKVVVCGDRYVGKSSVVSSWSNSKKHGKFIEKRKITQSQVEITRMEIKNEYFVDFYDIVGWGGEPPSSNNSILSEGTNFVLIVYDTSNNQSWINATTVWLEWFEKFSPNVNIMLLGTKSDAPRKVSSIKDCENFCKCYILKREEEGNYGTGNGLFFMEVSPKVGTNMDLTLSILLIRVSHLVSVLKESENVTNIPPLASPFANQPSLMDTLSLNQNNSSISQASYFNEPASNTRSIMNYQHEKTPISHIKKKVSSSSQTPPDFHRSKPIQQDITLVNDLENNDFYGINASGYITLPPSEITEENRFPFSSTMKSAFSQKVQSYQETKEGLVIPVVEADLFPNLQKLNYSKPMTTPYDNTGAKLILSINLGEGRICKVGVVSGDNIFQLADLVIKQHQVDPKMRQEIAFNIRNSINRYIEKQQGSDILKKNNNPRIREAEQFNQTAHSLFQNSTSFQPFNFASDHLQTRPIRPPILQLKITISKGKSGVIMVREGDDITELSKNFVNTFGLKKEQLPKIVEKIKKHLEVDQDDQEKIIKSSKKLETEFNSEQKRKTLFNLDVEISEGNSKILSIREGDVATNVAKEFSRQYGIGENAELMLVQLIQYHMKNYIDQKSK